MIYKSPIKINNSEQIFEKITNGNGVIIFGTGNYGMLVLAALKKKI